MKGNDSDERWKNYFNRNEGKRTGLACRTT